MKGISMRSYIVFIMALLCGGAAFSDAPKPDLQKMKKDAFRLYVAPDGNDAWDGTSRKARAESKQGPLASMAGARDRIRELRKAGTLHGRVAVEFAGGRYPIAEPVVFTPEDSGAGDEYVLYHAAKGEMPIISGGQVLKGWRVENGRWVLDIPEVKEGKWRFSNLWANGERRTPARTPNVHNGPLDLPDEADFMHMDGAVEEKGADGKVVKSGSKFRFKEGDIKPSYKLDDAIFVIYHSWETSEMRVKNVDWQNRIVEFTGGAAWNFGQWQPDQRYYVEQFSDALDKPGEWYLNTNEGKLYYVPMPGEDPEKTEVVAPVARQLVVLQGDPAGGTFVDRLFFMKLQFMHTEYTVEDKGHSDSQAAYSVNAAFEATGARNCFLVDSGVQHTGNHGLWWRKGCHDILVDECEISDLGAGGVRIGEGGSPATPNEATEKVIVTNSFIHDGGNVFRGAVGVWIGRSSNNTIVNNEICDFRYTGVSVGWSWGYDPSSANHNTINNNHIHHIGMGQLNDLGGIYSLGISPGSTESYNIIHDVASHPRLYGGWGLYTDEGSTGITLEGNLVYNTSTGGFHQHYGKENMVRNNIFAYSHTGQIIRSREEEHTSFMFEKNIVYFNNGQLLGSTWKNGHYKFDSNCYWDMSGAPLKFGDKTWAEWQAGGQDTHGINADPMFVDPEHGDFTLKKGSPMLKMGFEQVEPNLVGLQGDKDWTERPKKIKRGLVPLPETKKP